MKKEEKEKNNIKGREREVIKEKKEMREKIQIRNLESKEDHSTY